jgi:hypothetical protein
METGMKQAREPAITRRFVSLFVPFCPILVQRTGSPKRPWPKRIQLLGSSRGNQACRSWIGRTLSFRSRLSKLHASCRPIATSLFALSGQERAPPTPPCPRVACFPLPCPSQESQPSVSFANLFIRLQPTAHQMSQAFSISRVKSKQWKQFLIYAGESFQGPHKTGPPW